MSEENKVRDTMDAVTDLVKAIPVYQDLLQPAAQEFGKGLHTVAKAVSLALEPVGGLVWGYERIKQFVATTLTQKLSTVPPERIVTPATNVAGPALEALRYNGNEERLREMYANLLAAAMDAQTANEAHPAFVDIIKQLVSDEARLFTLLFNKGAFSLYERSSSTGFWAAFITESVSNHERLGDEAGCERPKHVQRYIDNLCRLGLTRLSESHVQAKADNVDDKNAWVYAQFVPSNADNGPEIAKMWVVVTDLGRQFAAICLKQ